MVNHSTERSIDTLSESVRRFEENVRAALSLADLDRRVLDFAIASLDERDARLLKARVENPRLLIGNTLNQLKGIRQNDSLRPGLQELANQCVVLLASYFSSGIGDLFRSSIPFGVAVRSSETLLNHEIRLTVREAADVDLRDQLSDLIVDSSNISFQDLQSIARAFKSFFGVEMPRDATSNDVVAGLSCRHDIVHNGAVVDRRCLAQLRDAEPRRLKPSLARGDRIQFDTREVGLLAESMTSYVRLLADRLIANLSPACPPAGED